MYLGSIMEVADQQDLYERPHHPYTRALISAVPIPDPETERRREREILSGDLPSPIAPPSGCRFRTRCRYAADICKEQIPALRSYDAGLVACHRVEEIERA
jgi:oligopeptide/dipeptide ABC transporter ATP-binding protein